MKITGFERSPPRQEHITHTIELTIELTNELTNDITENNEKPGAFIEFSLQNVEKLHVLHCSALFECVLIP